MRSKATATGINGLCDTCGVRGTAVLCSGETDGLMALTTLHHPHTYRMKETLYHEDTPALGLYVVCRGQIKLSRADGSDREQILRLVDPGGVLGEEALIEGARYVGTARALEESRISFIARDDLLRFLRSHDGMAVNLLQHLCRILVLTQAHLTRVVLAGARSRLASVLLDLGRRYGKSSEEGTQLSLSISRSELAAMVGLMPETVMRLLSEFRDAGIVRTDRRHVTLLQPERLETLT